MSEEDLNDAADRTYGNGYNGDDKEEYEDGLNYNPLKHWKKYLIAGTDRKHWVHEIIDEKDGSTELLPEALVEEYMTLKEQGLTTQANDLLVPYTDSNRTPVGMNYLGIIAFPSSSFFFAQNYVGGRGRKCVSHDFEPIYLLPARDIIHLLYNLFSVESITLSQSQSCRTFFSI